MDKENRKQELQKHIEEWQEEIEENWKGKESEVAKEEIRNLQNLIYNARKEIEQLDGIVEEAGQDPKELLDELKNKKEMQEKEKSELMRHIARLEEERANYDGDIYEEYTKQINDAKEKVDAIEKLQQEEENRDAKIKTLTKGRMNVEREIDDIEKQIDNKKNEIANIQYGTDEAMEEKVLADGTKVKLPKVNRIYQEIDELEAMLKDKKALRAEFQDKIDELKTKKEVIKPIQKKEQPVKDAETTKGTPLNTDELFREARKDGDLPPRDIKVVPIDARKFSKEQKEAWKGTPLDNKELFKEIKDDKKQNVAKIVFDITKGEYQYFNGDVKKKMSILNKDGLEVLNKEDKQKIIEHLIKRGIDAKKATKVDPYIYALLGNLNPDLQDKYIAAVDNPVRGLDGLDIEYNLKTRENNKKKPKAVNLSFLQKLKINRIAGFHQKNELAKVLRDKSKAKLYAVLAALGIGAGAGAVKLLTGSQKAQEQTPEIVYFNGATPVATSEPSKDESLSGSIVPSVTPSATPTPTLTVTPTPTKKQETENIEIFFEDTENNSQLVDMVKKTESQIGKKVTIDLGSHVYADPTDAIKETLGKTTQNNVYEKTKNADKLYSVTREGIYCPDGTYVAIPDKDGETDLKTAMQKKGIDPKILENIDTEELKEQGYKHMLHVEAKGISEWVEKGNTSEIQVDKFGNRVTKLQSEQNKEAISSDTKTKEEDQLSR